jgi:hypothetical protein
MRNQIGPTPTPSRVSRPKSLLKPLLLSSPAKPSATSPSGAVQTKKVVPPEDEIKFFAFKAIPRDVVLHGRELSSANSVPSGADGEEDKTCKEVVKGITERVKVLCGEAGSGWDTPEGGLFLKDEVSAVRHVKAARKPGHPDKSTLTSFSLCVCVYCCRM